MDVDFERGTMEAKTHNIEPLEGNCWASVFGALYCRDIIGSLVLAIHPKSLKFHLSSMLLFPGSPDSIYLEHGSCEAF